MIKKTSKWFPMIFLAWTMVIHLGADSSINIGSKKFTESVILGEILTQIAESNGIEALHRRELGGTRILWNGLLKGDIDIYPEYTGTISQEILEGKNITGWKAIEQALSEMGILVSRPLGFNNTYILGMKKSRAFELNIMKISDLRSHAHLKLGFSNEFLDRGDGWPSLKNKYSLPQEYVRGLDHDIAYRGLESGSIDVIDLYSTDAEISYYGIRRLEDDLNHFTKYYAVYLFREDLNTRFPKFITFLSRLDGTIDETTMIEMNKKSKMEKIPEGQVASGFLSTLGITVSSKTHKTPLSDFLKHTGEHLFLVLISLSAAILVAIPLGIISVKFPKSGHVILGLVGIIQTIPSLALLVFMIPILGIGGPPALMALFLYSLLPIVRNTFTGISNISSDIQDSAQAMGLPAGAVLFHIEMPLASPMILAGIKTSAVINVGTATLGALIGAGGYGQPILTGIRLDDIGLILQGAIPAAGLAILIQFLFNGLDKLLIPRGLQINPTL